MTPKINKAFISFRVGIPTWMNESRLDELMDLFKKYQGVGDEIAFFTSETHPPLPLETIRARAETLSRLMPKVRRLGYRAGINILSTIGHHNENLPNSLSGDYTPMTGLDGSICLGCRCPNDERMRLYVRELYRIITGAGPEFIWIDDDVRYGHMQIGYGCFCDRCLEIFAKEYGTKYTRESLRQAFNTSEPGGKLEVRKAWLAHNRVTINRLFELIEQTVHSLKPGLPLGFMTGERFFEGYDFDRWAQILSGPNQAEVWWRPGGGFYTDQTPVEMVWKSHEIGRQTAGLPKTVVSIQSEIENFPYQRLRKSAHIVALEAASHQAAGCTGAAYNVLSMFDEPFNEFEPLVATLRQWRPFFDRLAATFGRSDTEGVYMGWNKDTFAGLNLAGGDWLAGDAWKAAGHFANEIFEIGLPPAYGPEKAVMTVLTSEQVPALSKKGIERILSTGVYLDAAALTRLNESGWSDLTGFTVEGWKESDCIEELLDDPLNRPFVGRRRDGRQSFCKCPAAMLKPTGEHARILSRLVDYGNKEVAACGSGVFENRLGGRLCVAGYYPWLFLQNLSKATQVKNLSRWLSKDSIPAYVGSYHKIHLWARRDPQGRLAMAVINASMDPAKNAELLVQTTESILTVHEAPTGERKIVAVGSDGPYRRFIIPELGPWQMALVTQR